MSRQAADGAGGLLGIELMSNAATLRALLYM